MKCALCIDSFDAADREFLTPLDLGRYAALLEPEEQPALSGAAITPYVVERGLGRGGMAIVYLARDPRLEREVALKLVQLKTEIELSPL